jgi:putative ABC transport system permease protein
MKSARKKLFRLPWRSARQIRDDVDEELGFHLDMRVTELVALGLSVDDARVRATREFGDLDDARRYIGAVDRDIEAAQRRSDFMNDLWHDIGYAMRKLRAAPLFTLAAITTLALGIGANTAIFSVVNGVLLKPLPFPHADHLVRIRYTQQGHGDTGTPMDLLDLRSRAKSFVGISVVEGTTANLARDNADAERVQGVRVNANWFTLLRVAPLAGRFFNEGEDEASAPNVAVISEQLWKRDFGGDKSAIGKTVRINSTPYTIIGVVPGDRRYPITVELWMTKRWSPNELSDQSRGARWLGWFARVKDNLDVSVADNEVEKISEAMEKQFPEIFRDRRAHVVTLQEFLVGDIRKPLFIMLGAVTLVLLIACANVANLMLVRATAREGEMAVRTALGAGRGRLVRQLMTESVILSLVGAIAGLAVAKLAMHELLGRAPQNLPLVSSASIDGTTLAVTAIVALITGMIFGALPAMQVGKHDLATALRAGARGTRSRPSTNRAKRAIVIAEVAVAVTLLTGAGLLLHSFAKLLSVDPGFRTENVLSMKLVLPQRSYDSTATRNFVRELETRLRALPGVKSAGLANYLPLDGGSNNFTFTVRGRPPIRPSDEPSTEARQVTPDFFAAMGMPVVRGRTLAATDLPGAPKVLVVNHAFVQAFFANEDPIGKTIAVGWGGGGPDGDQRQIVGVVGDVHSFGLDGAPEPTVYAPLAQRPDHSISIVVRSDGSPTTLAAPLRAIVRDLDHELPVYSVQTMEERVSASVGRQRFYATLIAVFAAVALVLSAVGLYGVIAYAVSQRTHELGVRVALGATGDRISRMVIGEGLTLTAIGIVVGAVAAFFAGRVVSSLLFGVSALDPITMGSVVVVLGTVATLASWLPARRAARVDPLIAMRGD